MRLNKLHAIRDFFEGLFKGKHPDEPWLDYYSEEDRSIKFTNKRIYDYLKDSVGVDTDFVAINYFNSRIRYYEFFDRIDKTSKALLHYGVKQGDIVTICMPNTPEAVIMFYAINKIGAVSDMIHPLSAPEQVRTYLEQSKSKVMMLVDFDYDKYKDVIKESSLKKVIIVSVADSMPMSTAVLYQVFKGLGIKKPKYNQNDLYQTYSDFVNQGSMYNKNINNTTKCKDVAIILHSGGSTGTPKGIEITNYSFNAFMQQASIVVYNVRPKDRIVSILPIFHGFGLGACVHCPLCLKVETILVPEFDGKRFPRMMKMYKPNVLVGVPTLWEAMLSNKNFDNVDLSNLKYVVSGGDYLSIQMEERMNTFLRTHGANISMTKGYGMTESVAATAYTFDGANVPGSVGIPIVGNTFCICKPDTTEELPFGEEGEICVTGPTLMKGYLNNKEETNKMLIKHKDGKVYLHSGDLGYISADGILFFTQRLKRMIVSSGFNVYPAAIEKTINKHEAVEKVCVIGVPHPYKMHVPKAFIVLKEGYKQSPKLLSEIKELCKKDLAAYSIPKLFEFRDNLPKTLYGKVDFKSLEKEETKKEEK